MLIQFIIQLVLISLATAAISYTFSKSLLFEVVREHIALDIPRFTHLIKCPYCVSHWVALGLVLLGNLIFPFDSWFIFGLVVSWFAVVAISAIVIGWIHKSFEFMV